MTKFLLLLNHLKDLVESMSQVHRGRRAAAQVTRRHERKLHGVPLWEGLDNAANQFNLNCPCHNAKACCGVKVDEGRGVSLLVDWWRASGVGLGQSNLPR